MPSHHTQGFSCCRGSPPPGKGGSGPGNQAALIPQDRKFPHVSLHSMRGFYQLGGGVAQKGPGPVSRPSAESPYRPVPLPLATSPGHFRRIIFWVLRSELSPKSESLFTATHLFLYLNYRSVQSSHILQNLILITDWDSWHRGLGQMCGGMDCPSSRRLPARRPTPVFFSPSATRSGSQ